MSKRFVLGLAVFLTAFLVGLASSPMVEETRADGVCGTCLDEECVQFKTSCLQCSPSQNCYHHYTGTCTINGCCGTYIWTQCCSAPC